MSGDAAVAQPDSGGAPALTGEQLSQLLQLTQQMVASAEKANWAQVEKLDSQRVAFLNGASASGTGGNGGANVGTGNSVNQARTATEVDLTTRLLAADARVLSMARDHRDQLASEGTRLQAQNSARAHYADAQRLR